MYSLEVSDDTQQWNVLQSTTAGPDGLFSFTDSEAGNHQTRFYRVRHIAPCSP